MQSKRLIQIGGVINLLLAVFHLSFWKLFNWQQDLASLSPDDRAIMQVLNIHVAYIAAVFAVFSFVFSGEMGVTKLGRSIGAAIAAFYILRAANQVVFWDASSVLSWVIATVCLAVAALYLVPSMTATRKVTTL